MKSECSLSKPLLVTRLSKEDSSESTALHQLRLGVNYISICIYFMASIQRYASFTPYSSSLCSSYHVLEGVLVLGHDNNRG